MSRHGRGGDEETVESLRAQVEQLTAALALALAQRDQMLTAYQPAADGTGPLPAVPASRARSHRARPTHLRLLPGFVLAAFASLRWAWHVHRAATVAAGLLTFTAATGAAVVVAPHGPIAQAFGATPAVSAPADGISSAAPFAAPSAPVSLRLIGDLTRPGRLDARAASGLPPATVVPAPAYQPPDSSASSPSSQQGQAQPPGGPAVLQVPVTGIDLTSGTPQVITLSASGAGWVAWKVNTTGSDLDFSATQGVLTAGGSVALTVSVDRAQAQDRNTTQVFDVNGQQVTVTLPVLAAPTDPAPAIPAATDPAATDAASPSPASS